MMYFLLGIFVGLLMAILTFSILAFFRAGIEYRVKVIEKTFGNSGPRPKGAIIMPRDDKDITRDEIIAKNRAQGKDTPISELL
jgi:hypothetical protein